MVNPLFLRAAARGETSLNIPTEAGLISYLENLDQVSPAEWLELRPILVGMANTNRRVAGFGGVVVPLLTSGQPGCVGRTPPPCACLAGGSCVFVHVGCGTVA